MIFHWYIVAQLNLFLFQRPFIHAAGSSKALTMQYNALHRAARVTLIHSERCGEYAVTWMVVHYTLTVHMFEQ